MKAPVYPSTTPPTHTILLVSITGLVCVSTIPKIIETIDDVATVEECTTPLFPELISRALLGKIRMAFAAFIFGLALYRSTENEKLKVNLLPQSKLRSIPFHAGGIRSQWFFTSWSWNMLGTYFAISGYTTLLVDGYLEEGLEMPDLTWNLRAIVLLFETVAPTTMLTSFIVSYVLWDKAQSGNGTDALKRPSILLQHNANVFMSLLEAGVLGGMKLRFTDIAVAPLFGLSYVLFAWGIRHRWLPNGEPAFPYFFLDTTLGKTTSYALLGLLTILLVFYGIFNALTGIIGAIDGGFGVNFSIVFAITLLLVRVKD